MAPFPSPTGEGYLFQINLAQAEVNLVKFKLNWPSQGTHSCLMRIASIFYNRSDAERVMRLLIISCIYLFQINLAQAEANLVKFKLNLANIKLNFIKSKN